MPKFFDGTYSNSRLQCILFYIIERCSGVKFHNLQRCTWQSASLLDIEVEISKNERYKSANCCRYEQKSKWVFKTVQVIFYVYFTDFHGMYTLFYFCWLFSFM